MRHIKKKITSKSSAKTFELKWSLDGKLAKLFVTLPFSLNFRSQSENQVSDYRFLGGSSFSFESLWNFRHAFLQPDFIYICSSCSFWVRGVKWSQKGSTPKMITLLYLKSNLYAVFCIEFDSFEKFVLNILNIQT
jgi:hypothetical protein